MIAGKQCLPAFSLGYRVIHGNKFFGPVFNLFQGAKGPVGTILMEVSDRLTANYRTELSGLFSIDNY